jgi:hypothetical protein
MHARHSLPEIVFLSIIIPDACINASLDHAATASSTTALPRLHQGAS